MAKSNSFLLLGKNPGHLQACIDAAKPEFEVAKTASSVEDAKAAINELGSNLAFITMGGGFTNADFEEVRGQSSEVPWFRPLPTKPGYDGPQPQGAPPAEVVAAKFRKGIDEHLDDLKAGKGAGEIWYF